MFLPHRSDTKKILRVTNARDLGSDGYEPASYKLYRDKDQVVDEVPECASDQHLTRNTYYEVNCLKQVQAKELFSKLQEQRKLQQTRAYRMSLVNQLGDICRELNIPVPALPPLPTIVESTSETESP